MNFYITNEWMNEWMKTLTFWAATKPLSKYRNHSNTYTGFLWSGICLNASSFRVKLCDDPSIFDRVSLLWLFEFSSFLQTPKFEFNGRKKKNCWNWFWIDSKLYSNEFLNWQNKLLCWFETIKKSKPPIALHCKI